MVKINFANEQSKLSIGTLDYNVPRDNISRFVVDFIVEVFPILNIEEPKKRKEETPYLLFLCLNYLFMLKSLY